jgi:hypothetical protein
MIPHVNINKLPFIVNPYAVAAFNSSRNHEDTDIRRMIKEEFLGAFMEISQKGIEACEDFRTVNMYHLANSEAVHEFLRDTSSFEVLTSECSARANRLGVSIVPVDGIDIMKESVFYGHSVPFDYLDPSTYPIDRRPLWLPRFRRMHICDAISLHMEETMSPTPRRIVQSDTFFSRLRHLDEQDDFLSVDGYAPLKRMKVFNTFPGMFWKIFSKIFPPYDMTNGASLGLLINPKFDEDCMSTFNENIDKGMRKFINISRSTKNILDRMILGFDNIHHDVPGTLGDCPFGTDPDVFRDILQTRSYR